MVLQYVYAITALSRFSVIIFLTVSACVCVHRTATENLSSAVDTEFTSFAANMILNRSSYTLNPCMHVYRGGV